MFNFWQVANVAGESTIRVYTGPLNKLPSNTSLRLYLDYSFVA